MLLRKGIYYQRMGDALYLRSVDSRKDYLFNPIVQDILEMCKASPGQDLDGLCASLRELYEVENPEALRQDIGGFVEFLAQEEILDTNLQNNENASGDTDVQRTVEAFYLEHGMVLSATLELTYRCNERCIHCYVDGDRDAGRRELALDEYRRLLQELRELGCIRLLLTGGEVCLKLEFLAIVRHAVSLGMLVDVYTNGIGLDMPLFQALCDLKVNSVSFSLYGGDAKTHDRITRTPGSFDKTLHWLMMFRCAGVDTFIKSVAIRQNLDGLENLYRLGQRLNIPVETACNISDSHSGQSAQPFRLESCQDYRRVLQLGRRYMSEAPVGKRDLDEFPCLAGRTCLSVDPYGGVHPCVAFTQSVGNIRRQSLQDIWEGAPLLKKLRRTVFRNLCPECGTCPYSEHCSVCMGDTYSSQSILGPNPGACLLAQAFCETD